VKLLKDPFIGFCKCLSPDRPLIQRVIAMLQAELHYFPSFVCFSADPAESIAVAVIPYSLEHFNVISVPNSNTNWVIGTT